MKNILRLRSLPVACMLLLALLQGTSLAQQPSPSVPPEKAKQLLELLSDPEVKTWLEGKIPAATEKPDLPISEDISTFEASSRARIGGLAAAIPRVPQELARAAEVVSRDVNSGRPGLVIRHPGCPDRRRLRGRMAGATSARQGAGRGYRGRCWSGDPGRTRRAADLCSRQCRFVPGIPMAALAAQDHSDPASCVHRLSCRSRGGRIAVCVRRRDERLIGQADATLRKRSIDRFLALAGQPCRRVPVLRLGNRQPYASPGLLSRSHGARCLFVRAWHSGDGDRCRLAATPRSWLSGQAIVPHLVPDRALGGLGRWPARRPLARHLRPRPADRSARGRRHRTGNCAVARNRPAPSASS